MTKRHQAEDREIVKIYSDAAARYADAFVTQQIVASEGPYIKRLADLAASRQSMLDIGCGPAVYYLLARNESLDYTGLDFSYKMLQEGRRINNECRLVLGDARALPFRDRQFTCMAAMGSLSHLDNRGFERAIQEAARVCSPGGAFLLGDQLGAQSERTLYPLSDNAEILVYPRPEILYTTVLQDAGFVVRHIEVREPGSNEMHFRKILLWSTLEVTGGTE